MRQPGPCGSWVSGHWSELADGGGGAVRAQRSMGANGPVFQPVVALASHAPPPPVPPPPPPGAAAAAAPLAASPWPGARWHAVSGSRGRRTAARGGRCRRRAGPWGCPRAHGGRYGAWGRRSRSLQIVNNMPEALLRRQGGAGWPPLRRCMSLHCWRHGAAADHQRQLAAPGWPNRFMNA